MTYRYQYECLSVNRYIASSTRRQCFVRLELPSQRTRGFKGNRLAGGLDNGGIFKAVLLAFNFDDGPHVVKVPTLLSLVELTPMLYRSIWLLVKRNQSA